MYNALLPTLWAIISREKSEVTLLHSLFDHFHELSKHSNLKAPAVTFLCCIILVSFQSFLMLQFLKKLRTDLFETQLSLEPGSLDLLLESTGKNCSIRSVPTSTSLGAFAKRH